MNPAYFPTLRLLAVLGGVWLVSHSSELILGLFEHSPEPETTLTFFSIALIFSLSFAIFYLSRGTPIPNFVIAIFFGMATRPLLAHVIEQHVVLSILVGFGATLILFGGGLETPFTNFKKLLPKIVLLSFPGLLVTAFLFSGTVAGVGAIIGQPLTVAAACLLGAVLASTDPAAIIPIFKRLRFKHPETKDLVVSESAVTDVTGTLLTLAFLTLIGAGTLGTTVTAGYASLFTAETAVLLGKQLVFGLLFGLLGYSLLSVLTRFKVAHAREYEADSAFFLFIPVIIFTLAIAFGGSGYLAAFVAGLLFNIADTLHETERFFNHIIDGFFKPTIFLLLGALVDPEALITFAPLGLTVAAVFMFVIRPLVVFGALSPFLLTKQRTRWQDMFLISFVRETGAIPAVLLVTIASLNLPGMEGLLPVGMWVILATLIIEPPLTPFIAAKYGVAEEIPETHPHTNGSGKSYIVLGTRGFTWEKRLPEVAEWAVRHGIQKVVLMLSLEYRYQPELEMTIDEKAHAAMDSINEKLAAKGKKPLEFKFFSSTGFLQENIDYIAKNDEHVVAIFVGRKMLDYRLDEIKKLPVPLYFMA